MQTLTFGVYRLSLVSVVCAVLLAQLSLLSGAHAEPVVLDGYDSAAEWKVIASEAVLMKITPDPGGQKGTCLRIDYDFTRGSGYGIIRKEFAPPHSSPIALGSNYRFSYAIRGEGPSNTVEFKLIDDSGDNVWWVNQTNFEFPKEWRTITLPKRKISFAWGPAGAGVPLKNVRFIEFAITSFNGGKGTVWLDELTLEELPEAKTPTSPPVVSVSSASSDEWKPSTVGPDGTCKWMSGPDDPTPTLTVDFGESREMGGLVLSWAENGYRQNYDILTSADGVTFTPAAKIRDSDGRTDYVQMPETVTRFVRFVCTPPKPGPGAKARVNGVGLMSMRVMPIEFGDSGNAMMRVVAKDHPRGRYPRQFLDEATFWTIAGVNGDENEVLVDEGGAIEVKKSGFSLEPMIFERSPGAGGTGTGDVVLHTWADGTLSQSLVDGYVPAPIVRREHDGLALKVQSIVDGTVGDSTLLAQYTLTNTSERQRTGVLQVMIRPYQVNPVYQWLNTHGGVGKIHRLSFENGSANVDGTLVTPLKNPTAFGASRFEQGEVVDHLARGVLPPNPSADDPSGLASGVLSYRFALKPGESMVVPIAAGLHNQASGFRLGDEAASLAEFDRRFDAAVAEWKSRLDTVDISLPRSARRLSDTVKANLAYILINRDGPAIHPGSRSYERAWIRDGSLTSAALLSFGFDKEAMAFADWFGPYQYDNGKVPCCVDRRGPDPVPEHDSHGQYIWLVLNIFRHTGDSAFLARHYPRVLKAVEYIEFLRSQRMTPEYASAEGLKKGMYGVLPESISHEGYSAKPMHSYWDQFFAARGLGDAASIAQLMGDAPSAQRLAKLSAEFHASVVASLTIAMREKNIDYLPGCVELGDFDATSTTVALWPCALRGTLPEAALARTFDKYFEFFQDRAQGRKEWVDYTPYEHRVVGSMIMLGHRDRAHEMWDWFFMHQRPEMPGGREGGWRHWGEIVWKDQRAPKFIGDMPHTWVGSDFINAFRSIFMFERGDGAMILGAGLPLEWAFEGAAIKGLRTPAGSLELRMSGDANRVTFDIGPGLSPPSGGLWLAPPDPARIQSARVDASEVTLTQDGLIRLPQSPAKVEIVYRGLPR